MRHHTQSQLCLLAAVLMTLLVAGPRGDVARAADPDFTTVTDILGGQRHLLRVDDLIVFHNFCGDSCTPSSFVLQTSDSTITQAVRSDAPWHPPGPGSAGGLDTALVVGRMFDLPNDVVAAVGTQNNNGTLLLNYYIYDPVQGTNLSGAVPTGIPLGDVDFVGMADFTGDGYAELIVHNIFGGLWLATANDITTMSRGLKWGDEVLAFTATGCVLSNIPTPCWAFATGDFRGDGWQRIAMVGVGGDDTGLTLNVYEVDPATLSIALVTATPLPIPDASVTFLVPSLAAGRFGSTLHDQLVLLYGSSPFSDGQVNDKLVSIDFDATLTPTVKATSDLGITLGEDLPGMRVVKSGHLNWFGQFDQAVVLAADRDGQNPDTATIRVFTFDEDLNIANPGRLDPTDLTCIADLAVGNFDRMQANPNPPPPTQRDPNLQLAIIWQPQCGSQPTSRFAVSLYNVDPQQNFQPSFGSAFTYQQELGQAAVNGPHVVAGDAQGRSLFLGAPQKVTITSHIQPDIVLGIPPMHIDWINPVLPANTPGLPSACQSAPTPCVLNLTVMPSVPAPGVGFSTQYAFGSSASSNASRKSTTSYSFSTKESVETKVSYGIPSIAQVSVDAKFSAQQTHDSTVSNTYNTYSGKSQSLSATTGFADHLFYTESRINIYYYPVIGQFVCPANQPTCAESDKRPLHVQFSGPDQVSQQDIDATTQEWYQPIHEPGNIFSYPWTVGQLQQSLPNLIALTGDLTQPNWRGTDTSSSAYSTKWNQGTKNEQSSGSVSTNKMDSSVTVAAQASIEGFGISGSAGFEVNSSQSISTLNTSTQTLDASTGIQVNKPEFTDLVADNYLYSFAGYVLGQMSPDGTLQSIPLTDENDNPIDVQSSGPLTVAFLADPFQVNLPWWRQAYTLPDVGLNHPERWDWAKATQTATFNPADQSSPTPQDLPFYHIKGLFITPADASGIGPQLNQATAGDTLQLQARIYNFSLADMEAGTQVHVQFYGQLYENAQLVGASFLIGETTLEAPLCGFNSSSQACTGQPNWALASTSFNTGAFAQTKAGDVFLIFWVLVWMQDGQGRVVAELPGHGLTSGFTPAATFAQITDVPIEPFSNNVGFYGYTGNGFYLAAPGGELGATPTQPGDLIVDHLRVEGTGPIMLDQKAKVALSLSTADTALSKLSVIFYDGEPDQGGTPFDIMHLSRLRAHETLQSRVFFRPQTCGTHTLVAVASPATAAPATASATVDVTIDAVDSVQALEATTERQALPQGVERSLLAKLQAAEEAFAKGQTDAAVHQLNAFINEVEAQRGKQLTAQQADQLSGQAKVILGCV